MLERAVQIIVDKINEGRCALFTGPDLGESACGFRGLPSSWQIADALANGCGYCGRPLSLPQMADIYQNRKGQDALRGFIIHKLGSPAYLPLPIHTLIGNIRFPVVVSCGWDHLLEDALRRQQVDYTTIRANEDLSFIDSGKPLLYQPYGSISDINTLRITEQEQLDIYYDLKNVMFQLQALLTSHALLFLGYTLSQDAMFFRMYHEIRHNLRSAALPALAILSHPWDDEADIWQSHHVNVVVDDPAEFLYRVAEEICRKKGQTFQLPPLARLSNAPRLTQAELDEQAALLERTMDQISVADLIEQTNVPLLSREQLQSIEEMRLAYERLLTSSTDAQGSAHVWLRQGNLEYTRENYPKAEEYYLRALEVEPDLAEAYHNLHFVYLARREWQKALENYQKSVAINPGLAIVPDRYKIERILGSGGMGVIYEALDTQSEAGEQGSRRVAIKVLHRDKANTERVLEVFKREADILRGMKHPNIVHLIESEPFRGNYYIAMEYLEGQSLKEVLALREKPYTLNEAYDMVSQVCEAVTYAHASRIIHRDIKPSNILISGDRAYLIDFSLARPITPGEQTLLNYASGTWGYLAPEQAMGLPSDERTDIYGIATVFYEMLTKANPNEGTYHAIQKTCKGLNGAIDIVIEKARERNAKDRYPEVALFYRDLREAVALQPGSKLSYRGSSLFGFIQKLHEILERYRPVLMGTAVVLALGIPALPLPYLIREIAGYGGMALAIILTLDTVGTPFIDSLAGRVRNKELFGYGPALGVILGIFNSILWLPGFSFPKVEGQRLGNASFNAYLIMFISSLLLSLGIGLVSYFLLAFAGSYCQTRLKQKYSTGFFLAFLLICVLMVVSSFFLAGHFGQVK